MTRFILAFLFLISIQAAAQETEKLEVSIQVTNPTKEPIAYATVTVMPFADTLQKMQKVTDSSGTAYYFLQKDLPYIVRITAVGFAEVDKVITVKTDATSFSFATETAVKSLGGVVITATRPLMRQEDDKTIVDPEPIANSSTNAMEIMENIPGLFVDQDGNIYLNSTTPAQILINGRQQRMSAADVATLLKSLPPNSIASIEILRTPSARYDASGGGGMVNVILKKGVRIGLTGSLNTGFNQGRFGNRYIGFNLNNVSGKWNTFLNVQYNFRNNFESISTNRLFSADSLLTQDAYTVYPTNSYHLGYGAGYQINDKWEINYDGRVTHNRPENQSINLSQIQRVSTGAVVSSNENTVVNSVRSFNIHQAINLKHKIDSIGSEWTTDLAFTYVPNHTDQNFAVMYQLPFSGGFNGMGDLDNNMQFFSAETNYLKKLPKNFTLESGLKSTNVWFRNNTQYLNEIGGTVIKDVRRSGAYRYTENIHAAYVQASKTISGITIKAGTRLENTNMNGNQIEPVDTSFRLNRTDLFPYVYISKTLMQIAGYDLRAYLVYRRTINRPAYENLNPTIRFIDPYLFDIGNPTLRPQFTNNYEANISVDERPIFAVGLNETQDIFTQVIYQADTSNRQAFRTYDNLGANKEWYFRAMAAIPPGKKYFFVFGAQYNHNQYTGMYENKPLEFTRGSWRLFTYHNFKITPNTQLSMFGFAMLNGQIQFYELSNFGSLNFRLNQNFFDRKLTLGLSVNDVFRTNFNEFTLRQGTVNVNGLREADTRRFGVNLRYNFGLRKREERQNIFNVDQQTSGASTR